MEAPRALHVNGLLLLALLVSDFLPADFLVRSDMHGDVDRFDDEDGLLYCRLAVPININRFFRLAFEGLR